MNTPLQEATQPVTWPTPSAILRVRNASESKTSSKLTYRKGVDVSRLGDFVSRMQMATHGHSFPSNKHLRGEGPVLNKHVVTLGWVKVRGKGSGLAENLPVSLLAVSQLWIFTRESACVPSSGDLDFMGTPVFTCSHFFWRFTVGWTQQNIPRYSVLGVLLVRRPFCPLLSTESTTEQ